MVRALSSKVIDGMLWLPIKVARHFLEPVTEMLDALGEMTNDDIDAYFKGEKPKA